MVWGSDHSKKLRCSAVIGLLGGGSRLKMGIHQRACVIVMKGGDLSSEGPAREVPQAMNEGTKEEETVEGRQGG